MGQAGEDEHVRSATRLGQSTAPIGVPRPAASVPLPGTTVDGAASAMLSPAPAAAPASAALRVALDKP